MEQSHKRVAKSTWITAGVFVAAIVFFISTVWYLSQNPTNTQERVAWILEDPRIYYGKDVTVSGEVGDLIGSRAFTINSPSLIGGSLLVLSKKSLQPVGGGSGNESFLQENQRVNLKGEVQVFNLKEVEKELGVDLLDAAFLNWEGRPVIITSGVETNI